MGLLVDSLTMLMAGARSYMNPPLYTRDPALKAYFGYGPTASGANVNESSALNYSAWWSATQIISNAVASLPLFLYRRRGETGKEKFIGHPLYRILHDEFNPEMTSVMARKTMQAHVLSWGNAYGEIERDNAGRPLAIHPLTPDRVTPERNQAGAIVYRVHNSTRRDSFVPAEDMLHIPGLAYDGLKGYSVVAMARETIGLGLTAEKYGAQFFGNGAVSSLVAKHPGQLSPTAHDNLKKDLEAKMTGERRHSVLLLEENMSVEKITIPPDDAQFLETRKFSVVEVARWFNLPPHKLAELERATFSNIEHQAIEFVVDTLRPWLVVWEAEYERKLIRPLERTQQFVKHSVDGLLRGDFASRVAGYAVGRQWGWMSADDVRELEDMNPLPGVQGRVYLVPVNMTDAARLDEVIDHQLEPAPQPVRLTQPPAPEPTPSPARTAPAARAEIISAQRTQWIEAHSRMIRREGQAAKRAAKKGPEGLRLWAEPFYAKHGELMREALLPVLRAHLAYLGSEKDPVEAASFIVGTHVNQSLADLRALDGELGARVDDLVMRWEIQRPPHVADALMAEEIQHAVA